jgi:hypothetical protein
VHYRVAEQGRFRLSQPVLRCNSTRNGLPKRRSGEVGPGGIRTTSWPWLPSSGWDCAREPDRRTPSVSVERDRSLECGPGEAHDVPAIAVLKSGSAANECGKPGASTLRDTGNAEAQCSHIATGYRYASPRNVLTLLPPLPLSHDRPVGTHSHRGRKRCRCEGELGTLRSRWRRR